MSEAEIRARLAHIESVKGDDEVAHISEDGLHRSVLKAIADGSIYDAQAGAALAISTLEMGFARWCA